MKYFDSLKNDFKTLIDDKENGAKLTHEPCFDDSQIAYVEYLKDMTAVVDMKPDRTAESQHLQTQVGQAVFSAIKHDTWFDTKANCCEESEARLVMSLNDEAVVNPAYKSPIIIVEQGQPVAISKQFGERTVYGLEDVPEYGLYRGLFHSTDQSALSQCIPLAEDHAWTVALDDKQSISRLYLGNPIRPSLFLVPQHVRNEMSRHQATSDWGTLENWIQEGALYSHDDIQALATLAIVGAKPLDY